ncbi:hypothetical protein Tco_1105404 [Tanacetum coccineum]
MFPRRSEGEELEYSFFEGDGSSSDEWRDYGMSGDDYEWPPIFDDDQYEEESMPVYDTDIEYVIEEEEGFIEKEGFGRKEDNIEDVVVVANDLCSSMIQTNLNVDFKEDINTKSHELVSFAKSIIIKTLTNIDLACKEGKSGFMRLIYQVVHDGGMLSERSVSMLKSRALRHRKWRYIRAIGSSSLPWLALSDFPFFRGCLIAAE